MTEITWLQLIPRQANNKYTLNHLPIGNRIQIAAYYIDGSPVITPFPIKYTIEINTITITSPLPDNVDSIEFYYWTLINTERSVSMPINIQKTVITTTLDLDLLNNEIARKHNDPRYLGNRFYILMNGETYLKLAALHSSAFIHHTDFCRRDGKVTNYETYQGLPIAICSFLNDGEIEVC